MSTSLGYSGGRGFVVPIICTGLLCSSAAHALELDYELTAGVGHSDNIARTADNEIEEEIASAGLQFSLAQQSRRLQADLIGNFAYYEYLDDTYDAEFLGNFAGNAQFQIVPERFSWIVADNFGQVLNDPFRPATPDNREYINYFMTGPDVFFGFGSQTRLRVGGRYAATNYEDRPFDSEAVIAEVALSRALSGRSSISLNGRAQETEYDEAALNADYEQSEAFVRYDITGARTVLGVDVGYTQIEPDSGGSDSGLLLRFDASRRLTPSTTASLSLGREFTSSGARFASTQTGGGVGLGATPGQQTTDPFIRTYATLGWDFSRNRTSFGLYGSWNDESYDNDPLQDQTLVEGSAYISRDLSSVSTLALDVSYGQAEFENVNADGYDEITARVSYSRRLSQRVTLDISYDRFERSSDAVDGDYSENRFFLSLSYGRGEPRNRSLPPQFGMDAATTAQIP